MLNAAAQAHLRKFIDLEVISMQLQDDTSHGDTGRFLGVLLA